MFEGLLQYFKGEPPYDENGNLRSGTIGAMVLHRIEKERLEHKKNEQRLREIIREELIQLLKEHGLI